MSDYESDDSDEHDLSAVYYGDYLVISGTEVAIDDNTHKIIGIVEKRNNKWVLVVPPEPTLDMLTMAERHGFSLPEPSKKDKKSKR
jgi:hypothetical protein